LPLRFSGLSFLFEFSFSALFTSAFFNLTTAFGHVCYNYLLHPMQASDYHRPTIPHFCLIPHRPPTTPNISFPKLLSFVGFLEPKARWLTGLSLI
jgi:hypothetical protein